MLAHATVESVKFRVDFSLRLAALQLVAGAHVDEAGVARQSRVHLRHPAEHLLGDPAVVRVALRRGPELAQVVDLAEVGAEVPPDVERQRNNVLRQGRAQVALERLVTLSRGGDRSREIVRSTKLVEAG